ncbi:hypothetical protein NEHOM01_2063 [Nematocida homosporus]|uniref:uncharacterized protein n=1 Tax=Nematocida homosporus TaxID=1912981 RepID=UPI00221F99C9|nr:uncharacterized protein NEHOM01_2063 [Nematocida homosporus]KAI5187278.1 hypothetical protein NEHOM01_2063 [Nematocida homosporus]
MSLSSFIYTLSSKHASSQTSQISIRSTNQKARFHINQMGLLALAMPAEDYIRGKHLEIDGSWVSMGLYVLLVLLGSVASSDKLDQFEKRDILACPSISQTINDMESIGFSFASDPYKFVKITPYVPKCSPTPIASPNQPSILTLDLPPTRPYYTICVRMTHLTFKLRNYTTPQKAILALASLRKIASIKIAKAIIIVEEGGSNGTLLNLCILSRVVNMLDCRCLRISLLYKQRKTDIRDADLAASLAEAQNTIKHAGNLLGCWIYFSVTQQNRLVQLLNSGITLLRPIITVYLLESEYKSVHLLPRLPLENNYHISIRAWSGIATIDFTFINNHALICHKISLGCIKSTKVKLLGLENAIEKHSKIYLVASWPVLWYIINNNGPQIRVYGVAGLNVSSSSMQQLLDASLKTDDTPRPRIIATVGVSKILKDLPCNSLDSYKRRHSSTVLAKYGICLNEIRMCYLMPRQDFGDTISFLVASKALSVPAIDLGAQDIKCCGNGLSDPSWQLQETVNFRLDDAKLDFYLLCYTTQGHGCLCQNICYNVINIIGTCAAHGQQIDKCLKLLCMLGSITAQKLSIINIHNSPNPARIRLNLNNIMRQDTIEEYKCQLNVKILVLDNVNVRIVYWLMGRYVFASSVELYLLNQHFSNLAIARILSLPRTHQITSLTLNNFLDLNEVKLYQKQNKSSKFSLFRYIEALREGNPTLQGLNLHKLFLQLGNIDYAPYTDLLYRLASYQIQPLASLFEDYLRNLSNQSTTSPETKTEFALYNIVLSRLEKDLIDCYSQYLPQSSKQPSPLIPKSSVEKLILRFNDNQFLTATELVNVIRWVGYRFKNIHTVHIVNIRMSTSDRDLIVTHRYLTADLEWFSYIYLEGADTNESDGSCIELVVRFYPVSLEIDDLNSAAISISISADSLARFISYPKDLAGIITKKIGSLQTIKTHLENNGAALRCPACLRVIYIPWTMIKAEEHVAKKPRLEFDPDHNFREACYFKCGHPVCAICVAEFKLDNRCPICRKTGVWQEVLRLIAVSLSNFLVLERCDNPPASDPAQPKSLTWSNGYAYFYARYTTMTELSIAVANEKANGSCDAIYLI